MLRIKQLLNPVVILLVVAVVAGLLFVNSLPVSSASAQGNPPPPAPPHFVCPAGSAQGKPAPGNNPAKCPKEPPTTTIPYNTSTTTTPPKPDIRPLPVAAWGSEVTKADGTLTLRATGTEAGDLPATIQVNFDLCAKQDVVIDDTGYGGPFVTVLHIPTDGVIMNDDYDDLGVPAVVIVDNTPMVNRLLTENSKPGDSVEGAAGDLLPVLRKGTCTTTSVEVKRADRNNLIFGFAYTTDPFGEFRVDGGFTRLSEGGPTQISWEYWQNI